MRLPLDRVASARRLFWLQELPSFRVETRGGTQVLCTPKAFHLIAQRRERSERTLGMAGKFSGTPTGFHPNGPDARYGTPLGYLMKSMPHPACARQASRRWAI